MLAPEFVIDQRVAEYVASRCGKPMYPPYTVIGMERDGRIIAGALFNSFLETDIEVTLAAEKGALSRRFLRALGRYAFDQLGCSRASVTVAEGLASDLACRLGFKPEGIKRNLFGPGRDGLLYGILKEEWTL